MGKKSIPFLFVPLVLVACAQQPPDPLQQALEGIDRVVEQIMAEYGTPGLA